MLFTIKNYNVDIIVKLYFRENIHYSLSTVGKVYVLADTPVLGKFFTYPKCLD